MFLITLIAGLILTFAGQDWFSGAETVGHILLGVTVVLFVIQLLVMGGIAAYMRRN